FALSLMRSVVPLAGSSTSAPSPEVSPDSMRTLPFPKKMCVGALSGCVGSTRSPEKGSPVSAVPAPPIRSRPMQPVRGSAMQSASVPSASVMREDMSMEPPVAKGRNDECAGAASPRANAVDGRNYRSHEAKSPDSSGIRRWTRGRDWRWLEEFRELELRHDAGGSVWRSFGVIRRHSAIALFAFIAWGCAHRTHPERNVMLATAECDVASPDTVGSAPVIPARRAPPLPFGAIVGAVADSASGLKIGYSDIMVRRLDQPS